MITHSELLHIITNDIDIFRMSYPLLKVIEQMVTHSEELSMLLYEFYDPKTNQIFLFFLNLR